MTPSGAPIIEGETSRPSHPPDRMRRLSGAALFALAVMIGAALNGLFFFYEIARSQRPQQMADAMLAGAIPAFAMLLVYLPVPGVLDRFDPEPWWCLLMAFVWGAVVATGIAGFVNGGVSQMSTDAYGVETGRLITTVFVAPVSEEIMKGMVVWGFFYFLRREFDGVVDGIIYATVAALGFAAVENVSYYARAVLQGEDVFTGTFILRGVIAPWGHPLYTSMTGIGIARESSRSWVRIVAPIVGLVAAISLHATWNFIPNLGNHAFAASLVFWIAFVAIFSIIVIALVVRKGATIRNYLKDEVVFGNLSELEVAFLTSAFGRLRTYFMPKGRLWRKLIRATARLALSKWHTARAMRGKKRTISLELIAPLRSEVKRLRAEIAAK